MRTIKQKTETVKIEREGADTISVTMRRMAWKPQQEFLDMLAALLASTGPGAIATDASNPTSALASLAVRLPELLTKARHLAEHLIVNSTDLPPADLDELDGGVVIELVRIAIEINLDAEVKNSCAGIAAVVVGQIPAPVAKNQTT